MAARCSGCNKVTGRCPCEYDNDAKLRRPVPMTQPNASERRPTAAYLGNPHDHPIWEEISDELARAQAQHGPMASGHEAQSVIGEEFHEYTLAVWFGVDQHGRPADPRAEAIQLAAMAIRYILDVADR